MATVLLEHVREQINARIEELAGAVSESQLLHEALGALEGLAGVDGAAAPAAAGVAEAGARDSARPPQARGARRARSGRKRRARGSSSPLVLRHLEGQSQPLDIGTVAQATGLSYSTAAYTLKKLASAGVLRQSSVTGARGVPKLLFVLSGSGAGAGAGEVGREIAPPRARNRARAKATRKARMSGVRGKSAAGVRARTHAARGT